MVRTPVADGMSEIWMLLPDAGATTFMTAIDALARRVGCGDERTADQRRADAAVQLALNTLHGSTSDELPREHGLRPSVQVTVALSTLLGLDEQPGELDGCGPIPASVARRIAADETGTWRRLVTDERGRLLDYGRSTYRPPKDLTEHVIARDRTCRFRNCNRQARHCDLDHEQPWEHGGQTSAQNLNAICSRHHHAKHEAGWQPKRGPDGSIEWTSPTGHTYVEEPSTYPVDQTPEPSRPTSVSTRGTKTQLRRTVSDPVRVRRPPRRGEPGCQAGPVPQRPETEGQQRIQQKPNAIAPTACNGPNRLDNHVNRVVHFVKDQSVDPGGRYASVGTAGKGSVRKR